MKRTLILNGSHSELYLIRQAKALGHYVITTGNLPSGIGHQESDSYIRADYSDQNLILRIAEQQEIDYVISCANDFGAITASYVAEKLSLPGHDSYETTVTLHTKDLFKEFAQKHGMLVSPSVAFDNEKEAQANTPVFPVIVKPVDLTGGKGVNIAVDAEGYSEAVHVAFEMSRKKKIVVERFIEGSYHSFSTFLVNQHVVGYYSDNEYSFNYPYYVTTSGGPADRIDSFKKDLIKESEKYAQLLSLTDGIFHMQYVVDSNYKPYIMDITRRTSGDLYSEPVEKATGLPWSRWTVMAECGYSTEYFRERGVQRGFYGRHCLMAEGNGFVRNVNISDELKDNIYNSVEWWKSGYRINNYLTEKAGIIFWSFDNHDEMIDKISRVHNLIHVEV